MPIIWTVQILPERTPSNPVTQMQLHVVRLGGWIIQHLSEACISKEEQSLLMGSLRGDTKDYIRTGHAYFPFPVEVGLDF